MKHVQLEIPTTDVLDAREHDAEKGEAFGVMNGVAVAVEDLSGGDRRCRAQNTKLGHALSKVLT